MLARHRDRDHVAAPAAVAAVGAAELDVLLAPERDAAGAAVALFTKILAWSRNFMGSCVSPKQRGMDRHSPWTWLPKRRPLFGGLTGGTTETVVRDRVLWNLTLPGSARTGCSPCPCPHSRPDGSWCRAGDDVAGQHARRHFLTPRRRLQVAPVAGCRLPFYVPPGLLLGACLGRRGLLGRGLFAAGFLAAVVPPPWFGGELLGGAFFGAALGRLSPRAWPRLLGRGLGRFLSRAWQSFAPRPWARAWAPPSWPRPAFPASAMSVILTGHVLAVAALRR